LRILRSVWPIYKRSWLESSLDNTISAEQKEKKIEVLQKSISELELKVSMLQNPALGSTHVVDSRPTSLQIIQSALHTPIATPFMAIGVKQEQLENIFPLNGPGSEQEPMVVDFEACTT
jgi:hypothetical protein